MDSKIIELVVSVDHIPSENTYLAAGVKTVGNRKIPYLYTTPITKSYKSHIESSLIHDYPNMIITDVLGNYSDNPKDTRLFNTQFEFYLKGNYLKRDLSNMKKITEDSLVNYLRKVNKENKWFDDSLIVTDRGCKFRVEDLEESYKDKLYSDHELVVMKLWYYYPDQLQ